MSCTQEVFNSLAYKGKIHSNAYSIDLPKDISISNIFINEVLLLYHEHVNHNFDYQELPNHDKDTSFQFIAELILISILQYCLAHHTTIN